ncbi:MAG: hypothetical protein HC865_16225 [Cyanobacteria bacterium RU_5_0]|nr:hypothetical protein [Cyanobacteria bacterium RU_5_0]
MDSWSDYYRRQTTNHQTTLLEEQCLYDHLLECVRVEVPEELLVRFRALFVNAIGYSEHEVWLAIERIVNSSFIEKDFKFILNRSCHILINHWLMQPRLHGAIPALVSLLEMEPTGPGRSRTTKRLRDLVQDFRDTEQFTALKRLSQVVNQPQDWASDNKSLGTLIRRYPCLYEHSLLTEDSTDEQRRRVRHIRRQVQRQFERDLAQYAAYRLMNAASSDAGSGSTRSPRNPTLLSDRKLDHALRQFGGKLDGSNTYRDLARRFLTYSRHSTCYRLFKKDLYEYLTESIDPKYGRNQFNNRLYTYLQDTLPDQDSQRLNDVLLVGTCRKLLNFLVVESAQKPNHAIFVDLAGNLGITMTIGLLLKILLICRNVKPYLEKQFAILFKHYEACARDGVIWLVESLENLNVAFSINFGTLSL